MRKIQRHGAWSTIQPPSSGPTAAAMADDPAQVPIARPRSCSSNEAPMIASEHGIRRAAPMPCTARAAMSCVTLGLTAHHTEAAAKMVTPMTNTRRRPKWSPAAPPTRMSAATQSV